MTSHYENEILCDFQPGYLKYLEIKSCKLEN